MPPRKTALLENHRRIPNRARLLIPAIEPLPSVRADQPQIVSSWFVVREPIVTWSALAPEILQRPRLARFSAHERGEHEQFAVAPTTIEHAVSFQDIALGEKQSLY